MPAQVATTWYDRRIKERIRKGKLRGIQGAAAYVRAVIRNLIRRRKGPSSPGQPPHTQTGRLRASILYAVDQRRQTALIGASRRVVGVAGAEHEHGLHWREEDFPARPFAAPGLERAGPKLPSKWAGAIR